MKFVNEEWSLVERRGEDRRQRTTKNKRQKDKEGKEREKEGFASSVVFESGWNRGGHQVQWLRSLAVDLSTR